MRCCLVNQAQGAPTKAVDEKFCSDCGVPIKIKAEICPKCGVRQKRNGGGGNSARNKSTAAILAFLLGGFGGHKFYLGQTGLGVVYLLFFWTFIPAIIAFVEFILYLMMSDEAFEEKYC